MYITVKNTHNIIGMVVLLFLIIATVNLLVQLLRKKEVKKGTKITALLALIAVHTQLIFGFALYFLSPLGMSNLSGETMKHTISRFYSVEHPVGMILAAILVTIGYKLVKKQMASAQPISKKAFLFYVLATVIVTYLIPWFLWY